MKEYVDLTEQQGTRWREPVTVGEYYGQTLPAMKVAARNAGALDFTAGDIGDTQEGLSDEFMQWMQHVREEQVRKGYAPFRESPNDIHGFPSFYQPDHAPLQIAKLRSYGMMDAGATPVEAHVSSNNVSSGRAAIDGLFHGFNRMARAMELQKPPTGVLDPLAWGGLRDLLEQNDLKGVYAPVTEEGGFGLTAEGLATSVEWLSLRNENPLFAYTIVPSNPSGERTSNERLIALAQEANRQQMTLVIDIFYLPISPEGLTDSPLAHLRNNLTEEEWANVVVIEGDTKAVGFPRTAGIMMSTSTDGPQFTDARGIRPTYKNKFLADKFQQRKAAVNTYPDPQSALGSLTLHTFPGGIHAAMGERYDTLEDSRRILNEQVGELIPVVGDNSFYSAVALVDDEGKSLIRDLQGNPVTESENIGQRLINDHQLAIAPMGLFRNGVPGTFARATAATTRANMERFLGIIQKLKG